MAELLPPVSLRGTTYSSVQPSTAAAQDVAPREVDPAVAQVEATDAVEAARLRAAESAVIGQLTPRQLGVQAARTLDEVRVGIDTRNMRLHSANREVERLETRLAEQLMNLSPSMSPEERQAYADAYRARSSGAYGEARDAAQDLADYMRDNAARVEQAAIDLAGHPAPNAVAGMVNGVTQSMQNAMGVLDTAVRQSPTGSAELQRSLEALGRDFSQIAERAALSHGAPDNRQSAGMDVTRPAIGGLGVAIGQLSREVGSLAQRAAGKFGVVGGTLGAIDAAGRIADGTARAEHYAGAAAGLAQVVGGVLRIGGVAVGGPVSLVAGGASILFTAASAVRDRDAYVRDVTATLQAAGIAQGADAEALARSNPESLRLLEAARFGPQQIRDLVFAAPQSARMHESTIADLVRGAQRFGLSPAHVVDMLRQLGPVEADVAINGFNRAQSGMGSLGDEHVLQEMRTGFWASDASRRLAELIALAR